MIEKARAGLVQCTVYIASSLDGFIARAGGGLDWLSIVDQAGEDYGYKRFIDSIDTLVLERKTYDVALGFSRWPHVGKRCVVMTHRPAVSRHGETFYEGAPEQLVSRLAEEGANRIYVDGGAVIQHFLAAGLVTDVTLSIIPILLGSGVRLFGNVGRDIRLALVVSRAFKSGLVQLEYKVRV